jgi:hypothetical protein
LEKIDGKWVTEWNFGNAYGANTNCQHTKVGGWWKANFEEESKVDLVRIMKRTDCCGHRAKMTVKLGDE